jgi:predicted component of type VI protein secretion system
MVFNPFLRVGLNVEQVLTGVDTSLLIDLKIKTIDSFN